MVEAGGTQGGGVTPSGVQLFVEVGDEEGWEHTEGGH